DTLVVLDALTYAGNPANLDGLHGTPGFSFVHGDVCDGGLLERLFRQYRFDTVVHFAAESHVDRSIISSEPFVRTNVLGTQALLDAALVAWKPTFDGKRFHHISTDEVYGSLGPDDPAFTEATPYSPRSPYAASKAASDFLVRAYAHTHGLPVTITNCSNNYGPYQFPEKLIPLMIINALTGKPLPVYGDGKNVRDWLYVEDHCAAVARVLDRGRAGEIYNVGGNTEMANIDLVTLVCMTVDARFAADPALVMRFGDCPAARRTSCRDLIGFVADRPGHDRRYAICADKLAGEVGFRAATPIAAGIERTLDWYLGNETWWRAIQGGAYQDWIEVNYGARA
ncbi:MAG TPA: dTDP-glucose 4,6-dehydratase, partial [Pseudolabrys sp.]|nr:dTDP-glucose 4,6-dehydratase [Pseudolabrys sp.]